MHAIFYFRSVCSSTTEDHHEPPLPKAVEIEFVNFWEKVLQNVNKRLIELNLSRINL